MDAELEGLKKKRMEQLKQAYAEQHQKQAAETQVVQGTTGPSRQQSTWGQHAEAEMAQQLEAIEEAVKAHFTKEALQRYGTLKLAHPETATQLLLAVAQAIESGKLRGMLGDEQLKEALQQLSRLSHNVAYWRQALPLRQSKGKETRIIRK